MKTNDIFWGRENELALMEESYRSPHGAMVVVYGRRRIGKSRMIEEFARDKRALFLEGLEGRPTMEQLDNVRTDLFAQTKDPLLESVKFKTWQEFLTYLVERQLDDKKKLVLVLDEFQWLAAKQSKLVSIIKAYWDRHFKKRNVMLILCGSVTSYMIDRVIKSSALYGRISRELCLGQLPPDDACKMFRNKRSPAEVLKYLLVMGGIPKYLEEIKLNQSFDANMNRLFFGKNALFYNEYEKMFYSQFREPQIYMKICEVLADNTLSVSEITRALKMASGGGAKRYLENLIKAGFIQSYHPYGNGTGTKPRRYKLVDEYLNLYYKYIRKNEKAIETGASPKMFQLLTRDSFDVYLGLAFERFCLRNAHYLAAKMGFADEVLAVSPYFDGNKPKFQIDLIFERADKVVTICEVKHHNQPIDTKVIPEVERKCKLLPVRRGYTLERALISLYGPTKALADTEYFHHFVQLDDIIPASAAGP